MRKQPKLLEAVWFCPTLIREVVNREYKYERGELLRYAKAYELSHYCQLKHTQLKYYDNDVALEIQALYTKLIKDGSK